MIFKYVKILKGDLLDFYIDSPTHHRKSPAKKLNMLERLATPVLQKRSMKYDFSGIFIIDS